jgi:hypothetical protein
MFQRTGDKGYLSESSGFLKKGTEDWKSLVRLTEHVYKPVPLVHMSESDNESDYFHWSIFEEQVLSELDELGCYIEGI